MAVVSLVGSKILLAFCNFLLLVCGFGLIAGGMLLLFDNERVLLSRLLSPTGPFSTFPHPLLYYISLAAAILGIILAATGILGCWASCVHNYCILSVYFSVVLLLLVGECAIYIIAWLWPSCMGLGIHVDDLINALRRNYGFGEEQFTSAVDLAQTEFNCCGIETANEYDTSLWRLQYSERILAVPLSCCRLRNVNQTRAYLNPEPLSQSLCQALERHIHEGYRHVMGCREPLERWYRDHYIAFLGVGFVIVLVEFSVLLSSIITCTRIYHHNQEIRENARNNEQDNDISSTPTTFKRSSSSEAGAYSNETYALTGNFKQYKLTERA